MLWSELDPKTHPVDPAQLRATVTRLVLEVAKGPDQLLAENPVEGTELAQGGGLLASARSGEALQEARRALERALTERLVDAVGAWVRLWSWTASEPGGGGPVRHYCCCEHSLFPPGESSPEPTAERVASAVLDWRAFLDELSALFARLRESTRGGATAEVVSLAASALLPVVLERTSAEDAWYQTFSTTVLWFLESEGYALEGVADCVDEVVSGRFHSWVAPSPEAAHELCEALGAEVAKLAEPRPVDALALWIELRELPVPNMNDPPTTRPALVGDAHRAFIEDRDRARDASRAERLLAALEAVRALARQGRPLTFERLAEVQSLVLGEPAEFRRSEAFAKGGRERYSLAPDTATRFAHCLQQLDEVATPLAVRAARAYLDVCFFHPFADGNARAARLVVDYLLTRERQCLAAVEPIFRMQWPIGREVLPNLSRAFRELLRAAP